MRVWIENPFDNLPLEGFRPQRYWLMAEAFARAGHETVLWTSDFNHTTKARRRLSRKPEAFALRLLHAPAYSGNISLGRVFSHLAYARAWRRAAMVEADRSGAPDIIIASTPPLFACAAARRLASRFGARFVVDVMDAWPETFGRVAPAWALAPLKLVAGANYRAAAMVTAVAARYVDLVRRYGFGGPARLFYHGIALPFAAPRRAAAPAAPLRLAYAGNLGVTYDLATVVRALTRLPGATLDIAGAGSGERDLAALASSLGLSARVHFRGYLGEAALADMLAGCDAGVVPMDESSCVGVPYKLCDYAKASLAIASSLGGESAELLAKYAAGAVYRTGDEASLARALQSLDVRQAGDNARRMAEAEFDARKIYDGYVRFVIQGLDS